MTDHTEDGEAGPSHRAVELGVSLLMAGFALIVMYGSVQVGIGWGASGPGAGFFPFYIGILILISSAVNGARVLAEARSGRLFASWFQLRQVLAVVAPAAVYVALVPTLGIYLSSAALIALFMKWLGGYGWMLTLAVAIGVTVVTFLMFEKWFLVPLPKGPLEDWLQL